MVLDVIVVSTVFVRSCFAIVGTVVCVDWSLLFPIFIVFLIQPSVGMYSFRMLCYSHH